MPINLAGVTFRPKKADQNGDRHLYVLVKLVARKLRRNISACRDRGTPYRWRHLLYVLMTQPNESTKKI